MRRRSTVGCTLEMFSLPLPLQILLFRLKHTVAVVTHAHVLQNFYTIWVRGVACQKQRLGPRLEGGLARGASKNLGPPTYFCNR